MRMSATIYYDGHCPFCANYTALLTLRDAVGKVDLVDIRQDLAAREMLAQDGFDLDQGMVFENEGKRYWGAAAVNRMAQVSARQGWFNRMNAAIFSSPWLSALLYPLLRGGRNAALFLMGRERVAANPSETMNVFAIFSHALGINAIAELAYYLRYSKDLPITWAIGAVGAYLILRPRSPRVFASLVVCMLANGIAQMPSGSNHAMLSNCSLAAIAIAATYTWARARTWGDFMQAFAPIGRALLATMYVFGVFHKINSGFLNPAVSCAMDLWRAMPQPLPLISGKGFANAAIYGTLIIESLILLGLLTHRWRYVAVMMGIAFHSMLSLSAHGTYLAFSTLTIALHLLFLSPGAATRIVRSASWKTLQASVRTPLGFLAVATWIGGMLVSAGDPSRVSLLWLPWSVWLICLVGKYGRERLGETTVGPSIYSKTNAMNVLSVAFFLSCFMPYMGLKTAQSMNMFANLTHEDGRSNHLVFSSGPTMFGYLNDVATPKATDSTALSYYVEREMSMPYYSLLDLLERNPGAHASFIRKGVLYEHQNAQLLAADIKRELHPRWVRSLFHFRAFAKAGDETCEPG